MRISLCQRVGRDLDAPAPISAKTPGGTPEALNFGEFGVSGPFRKKSFGQSIGKGGIGPAMKIIPPLGDNKELSGCEGRIWACGANQGYFRAVAIQI
jgi:hypothetical protein